MARPTEPIREHHKALLERLEGFWKTVENLDKGVGAKQKAQLEEMKHFLNDDIIPHAESEKYLYGKVCQLMKNPKFSDCMQLDHEVIGKYIKELGKEIDNLGKKADAQQAKKVQRATYRLQGLLMPHFEKEERIYLPIVDEQLSAEEVEREIVHPMHEYIGHGHGHSHGHEHEHGHGHGHECH